MKIALVSYEYRGVGTGGGIGTYVRNTASLLRERGHFVEVFTSGPTATSQTVDGVNVVSVNATRESFSSEILAPFLERHQLIGFDVLEGPEFGADAFFISQAVPELPLVVKLHTPRAVINQIDSAFVSFPTKVKYFLGGIRRGEIRRAWWTNAVPLDDIERSHTLQADLIVGPSDAIIDTLCNVWMLPRDRCLKVPFYFPTDSNLFDLKLPHETNSLIFLGRLEGRKGIIDLAKAFIEVQRIVPSVTLELVGSSCFVPGTNLSYKNALETRFQRSGTEARFIGGVDYHRIPEHLGRASIAIFPSIWESYGFVCVEAMAAGRAVVGSASGGMAEIIENGQTGLLVPPNQPKALVEAILNLLNNPKHVQKLGAAARNSVREKYNADVIGPMHEQSYLLAIANAKRRVATS